MAADVTLILAAVKGALAGAFPELPVVTMKRKAANGAPGTGGRPNPGPTNNGFVISAEQDGEIDTVGSFEHVSVKYRVVVEFLKSSQAKIDGADGVPAVAAEDPEVRDKRQALRDLLYKTLSSVPGCFNTQVRSLPVYEWPAAERAVTLASVEEFTFTVVSPRP